MEVTSVRVHPVESGNDRLLAFSSVVFDEEFVVHNMRLVVADKGVIVAMPNEEYKGDFRDIAHPISNDCRERIRTAVIEQYNEEAPPERRIDPVSLDVPKGLQDVPRNSEMGG